MGIIRENHFKVNVDSPKRSVDVQNRLLDEALRDKNSIKSTTLSRLTSIRTEITYFEQVISDRQGNLANTAPLNQFDTNTQSYRKITNFVILTDELDSQIDKDVFTNLTYEGSAKILPNTLIPNMNDYFIMKVFDAFHLFRIIEVNPTLIEKDSGYEIRFRIFRQDIKPETCELNEKIKERYTFDYNHIGTDFRTVLRTDEYDFIENSRNIMYNMVKVFLSVFYHKTLNTIMCKTTFLPEDIDALTMEKMSDKWKNMIGAIKLEGRSIYDISLVSFINKFDILSSYDYIDIITEHIKPTRRYYNNSIFSAIEHTDINRFKNRDHLIIYQNSNLYNHTNRMYGRFLIEHIELKGIDEYVVNLFPNNFITKLDEYSQELLIHNTPDYNNVNDLLIDMIAAFICEEKFENKRMIVVKLVNILMDKFFSYLYENEFDYPSEIFYTYPLAIYVLKYMTREVSYKEYK